jgi:hypothetical protein
MSTASVAIGVLFDHIQTKEYLTQFVLAECIIAINLAFKTS